MTLRARQSVELFLASRAELLECFFHHGDFSGVFVPGHTRLEPGLEVDLNIHFEDEDRDFHLRGQVRWTRQRAAGDLPAGIGIGFLDSELRTRDMLLDYAKGRTITLAKRGANRLPVAIDVAYKTDSAFLSDVTDDLSEAGAFIASTEAIAIGTIVTLKLKPPNRRWALKVEGEVTWVQKAGRLGFGVKFLFKNDRAAGKMREAVREIREQIARELGLVR